MSEDRRNPFLISPPPAPPAGQRPPTAGAEAAPGFGPDTEAHDSGSGAAPDSFITLPPGLVDSATHRIERHEPDRAPVRPARQDDRVAAPPARRPAGEVVFFPAPPGVTAVPSAEAGTEADSGAGTGPDDATEVDAEAPVRSPWLADAESLTVLRPAGPAATWRLRLPDGDVVELTGTTFVGRNPSTTPDRPAAALLAVSDPARSVSKTHALLEVDDGRLFVHDLDSTNGVRVLPAGAETVRVTPGTRVQVPPGSELEFGDFAVGVFEPSS